MAKSKNITEYRKITVGFVVQTFYQQPDKQFLCKEQQFIAGDDVSYEGYDGNPVAVPGVEKKEVYQPFDMVQQIDTEKHNFIMALLSERQLNQYEKGCELIEQGKTVDELPKELFED